jgi:hypothetical protein
MSDRRKIIVGLTVWIAAITVLHLSLNVDWAVVLNEQKPLDKRKLNVAYIPVT